MLGRIAAFLYGVACYLAFLLTFLYAVGFVGNIVVQKSIDAGRQKSLGYALAIDAALLALFTISYSLVSSQWFKAMWARIVPKPVERSTYVLLASAALILFFWNWQPIGGVVWDSKSNPLRLISGMTFVFGWMTVLITTFLINHFEIFGLRQVWMNLLRRTPEPSTPPTPGLTRYVRHHLHLGFLLALWSAPLITVTHLVLAVAATGYILRQFEFEEHDLVQSKGEYSRRPVAMSFSTDFLKSDESVPVGQGAVERTGSPRRRSWRDLPPGALQDSRFV